MEEKLKGGAAVSPDALRGPGMQSVALLSSEVVGVEPGAAGGPTFEDTDLPVTLKTCRGFSGNPTVDPDLKRLASLYTSAELAREARSVARAHGKGIKDRQTARALELSGGCLGRVETEGELSTFRTIWRGLPGPLRVGAIVIGTALLLAYVWENGRRSGYSRARKRQNEFNSRRA